MNFDNHIESQYRILLEHGINEEFNDLYKFVKNYSLKQIFSTLHERLTSLFKMMNDRLPTGEEYGAHFWAEPSRDLIKAIQISESILRASQQTDTPYSFDPYYKKIITRCNEFLSSSGGSTIPPKMDKIELYYKIPIFQLKNTITTNSATFPYELNLIGEGSYALVFKYHDTFYDKKIVLKRAKSDLNEKELDRFKREFQQMKLLKSPYVVDVFNYNEDRNEYTMEYMDITLDSYIQRNNSKLNCSQRKNIGNQVLRAFSYIHSKGLLHRDISPKNILIKEYEDILVVKVSDFGLVKISNSTLTTINTEFKGYFNDPNLFVEGFDSYELAHEMYALTRLLFYIMTGRTKIDKILSDALNSFVTKGLNADKNKRFKSISEISSAFRQL